MALTWLFASIRGQMNLRAPLIACVRSSREELNGLPAGTDWEDSDCSTGNSALYLQGTHKQRQHSGERVTKTFLKE